MRSQENENLGKPTPFLTDIPFADILASYSYELSVFSKQWGVTRPVEHWVSVSPGIASSKP